MNKMEKISMKVRKSTMVRPLSLLLVAGFMLAMLPGASAVTQARYRVPENVQSYTFSIALEVTEAEAYAGIQFGLTLSDGAALQYLEFSLGEQTKTARLYPENMKNGIYYFGFYTDTNAYQGALAVGEIRLTYTGSAPQTVTISEMSVFRVSGNHSNRTVKPSPIYVAHISRDSGQWMEDDKITAEIPGLGLGSTFEDVYITDWFYDDVEFVYARGLMVGTDSEHMYFSPQMPVTRAMVVTVLYRDSGSPDVAALPIPFADLPSGVWYTDAIKWGEQNGIILGYGDGNCGPDDLITREQLAAIIFRYEPFAGKTPENTMDEPLYADQSSIGVWAVEAVRAMGQQGIMTGKPGNLFDPQGATTRAELAAVLHRFIVAVEPGE